MIETEEAMMRRSDWGKVAALAVLGVAILSGGKARAQAIGFQPGITPVPDGVSLNVTPVVTADRRYVRMGLTPVFTSLRGVDTFSFGAGAVAGGGGFGGGGFGGFGGGGLGNGGAGNGGLAAFAPQADPNNPAIIPAAFQQGNQRVGGAVGNNGVAVIPGLAAVSSGWGFPYYGLPTYGYGFNNGWNGYGYGWPGYGYGYGNPFNNSFSGYAYYDVTNGGYYAPIYTPPQTVNAMGDVMGAIIQSVGGRR